MSDREERSDPVIGAALRDALGGAPLERVDWAALHAAVMAEAGGGRFAATAPRAWWQFTQSWARVLMPLAAAAALASVVVITGSGSDASESAASSRAPGEETALYAAVGDEQAQTSLMDEVLTSADGDWLFNLRAEN